MRARQNEVAEPRNGGVGTRRLAISTLRSAHWSDGKMARHSPIHRVTTAPSLKRPRNLAGIASRPSRPASGRIPLQNSLPGSLPYPGDGSPPSPTTHHRERQDTPPQAAVKRFGRSNSHASRELLAGPVPGSGSRARRTLPAFAASLCECRGVGPRGTRGSCSTRSPVPPASSAGVRARSGGLFRRLLPALYQPVRVVRVGALRHVLRTTPEQTLPT